MLDFLLRMVQLEAEERLRLRSKHKLSSAPADSRDLDKTKFNPARAN